VVSSAPFCDIACNSANCAKCTTGDVGKCVACKTTHLLKAGECYTKSVGCLALKDDDATYSLCKECATGYTLLLDACVVNIANCKTMKEEGKCETANDGYYAKAVDGTVVACTGANCKCTEASPHVLAVFQDFIYSWKSWKLWSVHRCD